MIETSLDFSGLNDIAKDLEALSRAENNKVLRDATRAGAEVTCSPSISTPRC